MLGGYPADRGHMLGVVGPSRRLSPVSAQTFTDSASDNHSASSSFLRLFSPGAEPAWNTQLKKLLALPADLDSFRPSERRP